MANPVGRPPKLTTEEREEVFDAYAAFIDKEDDPTMASFVSSDSIAMQYFITDDNIKDWQEFSALVKRAVKKQEAYLLKNGGSNKYNPTIAIFRLKQPQHGYTDRQDLNTKVEMVQPILGGAVKQDVHSDDDDPQAP